VERKGAGIRRETRKKEGQETGREQDVKANVREMD